MSARSELKIIVLLDHELKAAAKAMLACRAVFDAEPRDEQKLVPAIHEAMMACEVALYHVRDDSLLMLLRTDDVRRGLVEAAEVTPRPAKDPDATPQP